MEKLLRTFLVYLFFVCVSLQQVFAQQRTITGTVIDEKGQPLPGVTIKLKNAPATGTQSGSDGKFSLKVSAVNPVLVFTSIGYLITEVPAGASPLNVSLTPQPNALTDVVVVAFSRQKAATVTGSVSAIQGKDLVSNSVANVSNMLVGNAAGISGLQTSGEAGRSGANIYIRGAATYGNTTPLFVIDGVEQPSEQGYTQLNAIDANEIESVSILKDASSTAVYGIRGANGVIIVTTKRGRSGKPTFGINTSFGSTKATNLLHNPTSYEWASMRNEAIAVEQTTFNSPVYNAYVFSNTDLEKMRIGRDFLPSEVNATTYPNLTEAQRAQLLESPALYYGSRDLFAEQFGGRGPQKQMNLNVSGGTSKVKYFTSLGYFDQGSILTNTSYQGANTSSTYRRYNYRSNFDVEVTKNLTVSVNLAGQFNEVSGPGYGGGNSPTDINARYGSIMQYIFDSGPLTAPGLVNGNLVNQYAGLSGSPDNPLGVKLGSSKGPQNAIYNLLTSGTEKLYNTLLSNSIKFRYDLSSLTRGLSVRGTANYDDSYIKAVAYVPALQTYSVRRNPSNPNNFDFYGGAIGSNTFDTAPPNGSGGHNGTWRKTYFDVGVDYARTFGDHNVTGLLLDKAQKYSLPGDAYNTPAGLMGFLGRTTYNYKERYLAEFNLGYNGSEQFIEGKRFGFFPAYSAGWVLSNESFFQKNKWVTFAKIRASYGETGNDQVPNGVGRYLYLPSTYLTGQSGTSYYFGNSNGSVVNGIYYGALESTLGNPAITWERSKKRDFGIELKFLNNRLSFTGDLFKEDRDAIITRIGTIPYTYGVDASQVPPANVGSVTNHGYDIELGWADRANNFSYYVTALVGYARNKINYQAEAVRAYPYLLGTGFSIGQKKGYIADGFYNTPADLINAPYNSTNANKVALGDVRYRDVNGDGLIDVNDQVPIGYSILPQYNFSLKTGLSFKGFDVSALLTGTAKGSFNLANFSMITPFFQNAGNVMSWEYEGRWTADKVARGEEITYPRATLNGGSGGTSNYMSSSLWIKSNSFMRLKNIEIGYTIPKVSFLKKANINSIRVFGNGNNLFTWNSELYKLGIDPESRDDIGGRAIYPITRVFVFGAQVRF
jgi:TonB-linked SusC/RagA family outer membrane protein